MDGPFPRRGVTFGAFIDLVRRTSGLTASLVHGEEHWHRVALAGERLIAAGGHDAVGADGVVLLCFALLHDSRRKTNGDDPDHGVRAAEFARRLHRQGDLVLTSSQLDLLSEACVRHTDGELTENPTLAVCWDADRLNLWRVSRKPDPELLSTEAARRDEIIVWAFRLQVGEGGGALGGRRTCPVLGHQLPDPLSPVRVVGVQPRPATIQVSPDGDDAGRVAPEASLVGTREGEVKDMTHETEHEPVTDRDIEEIVQQDEAGIDDLMAAYEPVERQYFSAVQVTTPAVTYSTNSR